MPTGGDGEVRGGDPGGTGVPETLFFLLQGESVNQRDLSTKIKYLQYEIRAQAI